MLHGTLAAHPHRFGMAVGGTCESTPVSLAACGVRIDGINIASTTGNDIGTTYYFKEILAPG